MAPAEEPTLELIEVVKAITYLRSDEDRHDLVFKRMQKIAYLCELISIKETGESLTNTAFYHRQWGPYSESVNQAVMAVPDDLEIVNFRTQYGDPAKKIKPVKEETNLALSEPKVELVKKGLKISDRWSTNYLTLSLKEHIPFIWTKQSDKIDNERYRKHLEQVKASNLEIENGDCDTLSTPEEIQKYFDSI